MQTPNLPLPSGTITFLFTDVQGSTTLWEREPAAMQKATERHNAILHAAVANHGGRVFKIVGDGFQAAFPLPLLALQAALEAQHALAAAAWETTEPLCVRMGLHSGPAEVSGDDYISSHTLNRVARICSAGHGGQILLSLATEELLRGHLSETVSVKDMGEHFLKGLTQPERIFQVVAPGLPANFPPLVTELRPRSARQIPLLLTKLHIPNARPGWVGRPRLFARLDQVSGGQTALLSAPAGYGKTALLAQWIARRGPRAAAGEPAFAWLALDEADNDPVRFWSYLVAALQTCPEAGSLGSGFLEMVQAPQAPSLEQSLVLILNEIERAPGRVVVVLDDYHAITDKQVHASLGFFIEHLPTNLILILAGRGEPPLALARYRTRGRLVDLHAADLRFNSQETGVFFKTSMPLGLSDRDIAVLDQRVEGWVAGLQLAALSMQGLTDRQSFIQAFTGDDRYILDYLTQEILSRQPPEIQDFLLKTSILDRMNAGLCEKLAGAQVLLPGMVAQGAQAMLEFLDRANLFIIPLDNRRTWYRYHRLFADLLQVQLRQKDPAALVSLHRQAADWFASHGLPAEAFQHAVLSSDLEKAAVLLGEQLPELVQHGETATLQAWLGMFPPDTLLSRPELCLASAWAALYRLKFDEVELWAQRTLEALAHTPGIFSDLEMEDYHGQLDALRATVAINQNHHDQAIQLCESALQKLHGNTDTLRSLLYLNLGDAYSSRADFSSAVRAYQDGLEVCRTIGNHTLDVIIIGSLGDLYQREGQLRQAEGILQQALMVEKDQLAGGGPQLVACGKPLAFLAHLYIEWNRLADARQVGDKALDYCQKWQHPNHLLDCWIIQARLCELEGDAQAGLRALQRAREHVQQIGRIPGSRAPVQDYLGRIEWAERHLRMRQGDFSMATKWQTGYVSTNIDEMDSQAVLEILHGEPANSIDLANKILEISANHNWLRFQIEGRMLLGLAYHLSGNPTRARQEALQALELAEPEGYVRLFVDKGAPMQALLEEVRREVEKQARDPAPMLAYIDRLLEVFSPASNKRPAPANSQSSRNLPGSEGDLPTPLSERERQILRLLAGGLSNDDIAANLFLSTNTVKTHLKRIFEKMGVNSRLEAVTKARAAKVI